MIWSLRSAEQFGKTLKGMLIDTHCHLNDTSKFPDLQSELDRAKEVGVERMILVGVKPDEWASTLALTHEHEGLFCILGWHPNYTADYTSAALEQLKPLLQDANCLAVGEIGLDYHWDFAPREIQFQALQEQLDLAEALSLPVVFHAREAYGDLLTVLESRSRRPYLLHCFAGSEEDAKRAVDLDCYFGIDGPVTYKKSDDLRSVLSGLPLERIVLETDAPYLTPIPFRGKQNRPAYIPYINQSVSELRGLSPEDMAHQTTSNALRFFGTRLR